MSVIFKRVALIGLGLIGSSIAHAAKKHGLAGEIVGHARSRATRARALELGFIDRAEESAEEAARGADLVILCVPVGLTGALCEAIAPALKPGAIVSDVGSVKQSVIDQGAAHIPDHAHFIPAHPIAGTEESGPDAGFAELFLNRWCIFTPPPGADGRAVARLAAFWEGMGANVEDMTPEHHDRTLAVTSHLPHLIAYTIVGTASELEDISQREVIKYSAGGFRDFTRIAASDPVMWRDVFLHNREAVLEMLGRLTEDLIGLQKSIRKGDGEALQAHFTRTRDIRRSIIEEGQESPARDFGRWREPGPEEG